ncbi:MAG: Ldh family oxidoreductase [Acidimicrobiales bacterium]
MHDYFAVPSELAVRVAPPVMAATVTALFEALGMAGPHAAQCAETLLYADRRGIDSHGVSNMFPYYVADLRAGRINATPSPWSFGRRRPPPPSTATEGWAWPWPPTPCASPWPRRRPWAWARSWPATAGTSAPPPTTPTWPPTPGASVWP